MKTLFRFIKGALIVLLAGVLTIGCQTLRNSGGSTLVDKPDGALRIATHNVHYILVNKASGAWSLGDWEQQRKFSLDAAFRTIEADIIAFQEMESFSGGDEDSVNHARAWLLLQNPHYAAAAVGDWQEFPSTQPVLYRPERLEVLEQGWFFFSETPDVIYSRTFDGSYPAFASWVHFNDRFSDTRFRIVNVHVDFRSAGNRRRSVELIIERMTPWIEAGETLVLAGDLNARLGSVLHRRLEAAGLIFAPVQGSTYHFGRGLNLFAAIDHLAFRGDIETVGEPMVLRRSFAGRWPSDHYPLFVDVELGSSR